MEGGGVTIHRTVVREDHRNMGVYTSLVKFAVKNLKKRYGRIEATVNADWNVPNKDIVDEKSKNLYLQLGFEPLGKGGLVWHRPISAYHTLTDKANYITTRKYL